MKTIPNAKLLHKKEAVIQRRMQELRGQLGPLADDNYEYKILKNKLQEVQATLYGFRPLSGSELKQASATLRALEDLNSLEDE